VSKIGIGIGEDFPVEDAKTPPIPPPDGPGSDDARRRHWRWHFFLHLVTRIAFIALIIAAIVWMFSLHYFSPGPYAHLPPYGYYPYHSADCILRPRLAAPRLLRTPSPLA
jgi:nitrate reductase NapE component